MFVSSCLKALKKKNWIIVSYSDTAMNHHGYIYQALNFYYTGLSKKHLDPYTEDNKHARHLKNKQADKKFIVRSEKHRYIYFATNYKKQKKIWLKKLRFEILSYPKGDNSNYKLGYVLKPTIVEKESDI